MFSQTRKDRENEAIGAALERACEVLPEGWELRIEIEQGSGSAVLSDPDGEDIEFPSNREWLSDEINDAVDHALEVEGVKPVPMDRVPAEHTSTACFCGACFHSGNTPEDIQHEPGCRGLAKKEG